MHIQAIKKGKRALSRKQTKHETKRQLALCRAPISTYLMHQFGDVLRTITVAQNVTN